MTNYIEELLFIPDLAIDDRAVPTLVFGAVALYSSGRRMCGVAVFDARVFSVGM